MNGTALDVIFLAPDETFETVRPALPIPDDRDAMPATALVLMENATAGGRPSVWLYGRRPDGSAVAVQTTYELMKTAFAAFQGWEQRTGYRSPP